MLIVAERNRSLLAVNTFIARTKSFFLIHTSLTPISGEVIDGSIADESSTLFGYVLDAMCNLRKHYDVVSNDIRHGIITIVDGHSIHLTGQNFFTFLQIYIYCF